MKQHPKSAYYIFLGIIGAVFIAFTIVFLCFPRATYSELERRDLAEFPDVSQYSGRISELPGDISTWFSDSEPYRDRFMGLSMMIRDAIGMSFGDPEESVSYRPTDTGEQAANMEDLVEDEELTAAGNPMEGADAKKTNRGTIVVGSGDKVRGMSAFGGSPSMGDAYIAMVSEYTKAFPGINIYSMIIPTEAEFYIPQKASNLSKPQRPVIDYVREHLPAGVKFVDAHKYLAAHTNEDIYLRTDHHWSPLGAFYGAKAFAKEAGVPFKELDNYERHTVGGFVGSMYGYTQDAAIKKAPEDFIYYTPKDLDYTTTFVRFRTDKDRKMVSADPPVESSFFKTFSDGSSQSYLTFMGGDQYNVKVKTGTPSTRKLLIIKDSYGNALPGYLFYSFGEVHVVDFRYFPYKLTDYVKENGITDLLFSLNIFNSVSSGTTKKITSLLEGVGFTGKNDKNNSDSKKK